MHVKIALILAGLCFSQVTLIAHQDPMGDTHPVVDVKGGMFWVSYASRVDFDVTHWGTIFTPEGKVVVPKFRMAPRERGLGQARERVQVRARKEPSPGLGLFAVRAGRLVMESEIEGRLIQRPLPFASSEAIWISEWTIAQGCMGVTWSSQNAMMGDEGEPVELMFSTTPEAGFSEGKTVLIGEPATIYSFPSASAPFWAADRWWIAWIRLREGKTDRDVGVAVWETVLTSVYPETGDVVHKVLPGLSSWNTGLSLAVTNGWMCIAWHASVDGSYPGTAKIVTAFEKLPE